MAKKLEDRTNDELFIAKFIGGIYLAGALGVASALCLARIDEGSWARAYQRELPKEINYQAVFP